MPQKRKQNIPALTLDLEGPKITADRFRRAVDAFFAIVDEVSRQIVGRSGQVRWVVSMKGGSIHLNAVPEAAKPDVAVNVRNIAHAVKSGIALIGRRPERPRYFTDDALRHVRELASVPEARQIDTAQVTLASSTAKLTPKTIANIDVLLGAAIKDYGTLEGRLLVLSAQGGTPSIAVVDPLSERAVRCWVSDDLFEEAIKAFRKRVSVTGLIHYRRDGQPNSIEVDELSVFPEPMDLPSAEEVHGILSKEE
jgi:hypothetical protein